MEFLEVHHKLDWKNREKWAKQSQARHGDAQLQS